jgi:hypothetical protein
MKDKISIQVHQPDDPPRFVLVSNVDLPARMRRPMCYSEAYTLACDWNAYRPAEQMATIQPLFTEKGR